MDKLTRHASASARSDTRRQHWRRETVELASVFVAVALADLIANVVVHGHDGPFLLIASALALMATAAWHGWWSHRHPHAPPGPAPGDIVSSSAGEPGAAALPSPLPPQDRALWRIRATVTDAPGSLAALCRALADLPVNIISMQAHPLADVTIDEFVVQAHADTPAQDISRAVVAAGGTEVWLERADAHDLVDVPTRILNLATRTALDAAELPLALRQLFGRCTIRSLPAEIDEDDLDGSTMRLRDPSGGVLVVTRDEPPFTPTEFARARALIELDGQLGPRVPDTRDLLTLPAGNELTVRRADPSDRQAALALHERCSTRTLRLRYHGPVGDADRYIGHLLEPRYGQTLTVETGDGDLVALAHLMWDDGSAEIAVLVEDAWQRRGLGAELVRRLAELARDAGIGEVYAVTTSSNTGMVATLRRLGVPLDYQVEEATLVITAHLAPEPAATRR
ncbi:GNAT family N-acetyltransferase [Streptacidiphilus sp. PB12-B1b]|uniref:GNAT family N-acetyltransferase n=1 Tax=Streptacidiphilus sp. PB12-B1b TaxID=2705012 RepID=UPI0015F8BD58|nr:GNAT family N-acetyltransferase [Streptacidiphilus sp. PB12-B1b]QMU76224.1 GNAT family N-acetyltransferase [Streptacidiphilus sp. PB12-B1b]